MATQQDKDNATCSSCETCSKMHCDTCHIFLCLQCSEEHVKKSHKVSKVIKRTSQENSECSPRKVYRTNQNEDKTLTFDMHMKDAHGQHHVNNNYIENLEKGISTDLKALKKYIKSTTSVGLDTALSDIQDKEEKIIENVRMFSNKLRETLIQQCEKSATIKEDASSTIKYDRQDSELETNEFPSILAVIQSPYNEEQKKNLYLSRLICSGMETLWLSGSDRKIYQLDRNGSVLKNVDVDTEVVALSFNAQQELLFSLGPFQSKVYKFTLKESRGYAEIMDLSPWYPVGLGSTQTGDLLVSMRLSDVQSKQIEVYAKIVRYSGTTKKQVIEYDCQGKPLFSCGIDALLLSENGNEDICVADHAGESVVVVDATGKFRFKYEGVPTSTKYKSFRPLHIATDILNEILIGDFDNDVIHVIDCNGAFIRYIKYPCNGGISVDSDNNLLAGDYLTGEVKVIKYLAGQT